MNVRSLAKTVAEKLGRRGLVNFASELVKHLDPQQVAILTNYMKTFVASEKDMSIQERVARRMLASQIANTIAEQMGGAGRLRRFLGAQLIGLPRGLGIKWPNRQRSKGNYVEITLRGDDTYDMEFFNVSVTDRKSVKKYRQVYFDQLVDLFESQTGWYLRI